MKKYFYSALDAADALGIGVRQLRRTATECQIRPLAFEKGKSDKGGGTKQFFTKPQIKIMRQYRRTCVRVKA